MTQQDSFLPEGYEAPRGSGHNYAKIEKGENRFRILSKPILGWIDWDNNKPIRCRMADKPAKAIDPAKPIKHFWAFVVWNYQQEAIQILEITQATIQASIQALAVDSDWGNPFMYDIKITKTGEKLDTTYVCKPVPHKPVTSEIQEAYMMKGEITLEKLYAGEDPFENGSKQETPPPPPAPVKKMDPLPF